MEAAVLGRFRLCLLALSLSRCSWHHAQGRHGKVGDRAFAPNDGLARLEGVGESHQRHLGLQPCTSARVDGCEAGTRAGLQREVPGAQNRDTRHAATGDAIEVETLELEAKGLDGAPRRALGRLDVVEAFGAVEINKDRSPCSTYALLDDGLVSGSCNFRAELSARVIFLLGGA